jgi:hypothetical protein
MTQSSIKMNKRSEMKKNHYMESTEAGLYLVEIGLFFHIFFLDASIRSHNS